MEFRTKAEELDIKEVVNSEFINWDFFKNSVILITGGTGLIGSHIIKSILYANETYETNIKIIALVRNKKKAESIFNCPKELKLIVQNIEEPVKYRGKVDYIIHAASNTSSESFVKYPVETLDTILHGTKNILEFARKKKVKSLVYISSMEVYGICDFESEEPLKESDYGYIDILNPRSSYPEGKRTAETMCAAYAKEYNLPVKTARLVQTIGGNTDSNDKRVFAQFARSVAEKKDIVLHTEGKTIRSYCYITDAITGIFTILERGTNGEAYNISNKNTTCSIREMAEILAEKYHVSVKYEKTDNNCYLPPTKTVLNTEKIEKLNWHAKVDLEEMYERLLSWNNKMPRIVLFGLIDGKNLGDPIIVETCGHLLSKICQKHNINLPIEQYSLFPSTKKNYYLIERLLRKMCNKPRGWFISSYVYWVFKLYLLFPNKLTNYYKKILKNCSAVIFAGGGLVKYNVQELWAAVYCITKYCEKLNIPVYFNAVGVEGYNSHHPYVKLLKQALNRNCVKGITTRDDIDSLKKYIKVFDDDSLIVGDPALYTKDFYPSAPRTDVIGVGTIRAKIFKTYGADVTEAELINFYTEMINRLEKHGFKWQLFTNGTLADYNFAKTILKHMNRPETPQNLAPKPETTQELVNLITSYKGIIASRMHAHIIALSYGIPSIGLIWNDKLKYFAEYMNLKDRFFMPSEVQNYDKIFDTLLTSLDIPQKNNMDFLKQRTSDKLEEFVVNQILNGSKH